jgi:hypothetical protein
VEGDALAGAGDAYVQGVFAEISAHQGYFAGQMRRYRWARVTVIVSAALVPVLSVVEGVPRWVLGALGGLAAVVESLNQLYRWRDSALNTMRVGNALESEWNRYVTGVRPYQDRRVALARFVDRVERIRAQGSDAFAGLWAEDRPPSSQPGPDTEPNQPAATTAGAVPT